MKKVCCFGEILLRFSPALHAQWLTRHSMPVFAGGAELNVAMALNRWNIPVRYCSALPDHYLGHELIDFLQQQGIDTSTVIFQGERLGTYFLPTGEDLKHTGVIYDRAHSSFSEIKPGTIDWEKVLDDVCWFHFSAICPALGENIALVCEEALAVAARKNILVSVDLNYRPQLWKYGKAPIAVMQKLLPYCQLLMGNIWSANTLAGIPVDENVHRGADTDSYLEHAAKTAAAIRSAYPDCETVALTYRFDKGEGTDYFGTLHLDDSDYCSPVFSTPKVLDKVGSGDCFMAGLIYGLISEHRPKHIISFAAAAAFGKLQEYGDATYQKIAEVDSFLKAYAD